MYANVGISDRFIRMVLGAILIAIAVFQPGTNFDWLGWVGLIPFLTGLVGWCPIYEVTRINTRKNIK